MLARSLGELRDTDTGAVHVTAVERVLECPHELLHKAVEERSELVLAAPKRVFVEPAQLLRALALRAVALHDLLEKGPALGHEAEHEVLPATPRPSPLDVHDEDGDPVDLTVYL